MINIVIIRSSLSWWVPPNLAGEFDRSAEDFKYIGTTRQVKHEFGRLSWWPKAFGFTLKEVFVPTLPLQSLSMISRALSGGLRAAITTIVFECCFGRWAGVSNTW